ncbi:hypothetical protein [Legionella waltersii]|uniref:Uncharacterized protein n=1 Tax=Legionella waltersii TaxID=66969 RepID=A0A0W1A0T7_9GAMM|nr:hypothetical protein [Legionella waltersii]KTD74958.1 hypothetical protein Lwal_2999 [Legionella waltersii]SNV08482.1 Uncharacterised protein [Legionella waltersii]
MISIKNIVVTAIVVALIRVYTHHYWDKGSYTDFVKTFKESCIEEGKKEVTDPRLTAAIEPLCECMTNNSEMQAALKNAYDTEDLEKAKREVKPIAVRIAPGCVNEYFGSSN